MNSEERNRKNLERATQERKNWEEEKKVLAIKKEIEEEKKKLKPKKEKLSTTKIFVILILINCTVVEIYAMGVMFYFRDLSALYTLITAVVGESITFATYCIKATKENSIGGIVYETALRDTSSYSNTPTSVGLNPTGKSTTPGAKAGGIRC